MACNVKQIPNYGLLFEGKMIGNKKYDEMIKVKLDNNSNRSIVLIKKYGLWGIHDVENDIRTGIKFRSISEFYNGISIVSELDVNLKERYKLMNDKLQIIPTTCFYDKIEYCENGLFVTTLNSKFGVIDGKGKEVLPCEYDNVYMQVIEFFDKQYISLMQGDNVTLVDGEGKVYTLYRK